MASPTFELAFVWDSKSLHELVKAFVEGLETVFPPTGAQDLAVTLRPTLAVLSLKPSFTLYARSTMNQLESDAKRSGGRIVEMLRLPPDERESFRKHFLLAVSGEPQMFSQYKSAAAAISDHIRGMTSVEARPRAPAPAKETKPPPVLQKSGRTSPRYSVNLDVEFKTQLDFVREHATNISKGGIFIRTTQRPGLNSEIGVKLKLPNGQLVETPARVVHVMDHPEHGGIGVSFPPGNSALATTLEKYLASLASNDKEKA